MDPLRSGLRNLTRAENVCAPHGVMFSPAGDLTYNKPSAWAIVEICLLVFILVDTAWNIDIVRRIRNVAVNIKAVAELLGQQQAAQSDQQIRLATYHLDRFNDALRTARKEYRLVKETLNGVAKALGVVNLHVTSLRATALATTAYVTPLGRKFHKAADCSMIGVATNATECLICPNTENVLNRNNLFCSSCASGY